jgi:hypothetical protein
MNETTPSQLNNVIPIDDEWIKNHLGRVVSIGTQSGLRRLGASTFSVFMKLSALGAPPPTPHSGPLRCAPPMAPAPRTAGLTTPENGSDFI